MNQNLANELVTMMTEDQRLLQQLFDSGELPSEFYHPRMQTLHERNAARLKEIIRNHGWPGVSLVGEEAAKAAWLIAQHAVSDLDFMTECVGLLEGAVARDDAAGWQLAFLQDRVRTLAGEPQYYGTQFDTDDTGWPTPFPIEDSATVNERRARLGLNTLEERLEEMTEQERNRRATIRIRDERADDVAHIHRVTELAFRNAPHSDHREHFIVDELRRCKALTISRVVESSGEVIAHIAISPISVSDGSAGWFGLGPISVLPAFQRQGVGSKLMRSVLADLEAMGAAGCVVLGDPDYYGRFGFKVIAGLVFFGAPAEYFQARSFEGRFPQGEVAYHEAFSAQG